MASLINKNTKKILELKRKLEELKDNCGENSFEYIKFFNDNFDLILNLPIEQIYYYSRENHSNFTKENIEKLKNKLLSMKISSYESSYTLLNFILNVFSISMEERIENYLLHGQISVVELDNQHLNVKHIPYNINTDDLDNIIIMSKQADVCYQYAKEIQNRDLLKLEIIPKLGKIVIDSKKQDTNMKFAINIFGADVEAHKNVITDENIKIIIDEQVALNDSKLAGDEIFNEENINQ